MYPLKIAYSSGRYHLNARQWQRACQMEIIKKKKKKMLKNCYLLLGIYQINADKKHHK